MRTAILTLVLLAMGCAFGTKIQSLDTGMSEAQVRQTLGDPSGVMEEGDYRALQYANKWTDEWSGDRADYWVVLREGKVTSYGAGEVRPGPRPQTLVFVPIGN